MQRRRLRFYQSITFQLLGTFFALFSLFLTALGYGLFLAEERERDRAILSAAARLQLVSGIMEHQALNYLGTPARDYSTYFRDVRLYYGDLRTQVETFDQALGCFTTGQFPSVTNGEPTATIYQYDAGERPSVEHAVRTWKAFREGLERALGDDEDEPRLESAAQFIMEHIVTLETAASTLHADFEQAARERLDANHRLNRLVVLASVVLLGLTLWWAHRALRPLKAALFGFERVAQGDFGHQVPVAANNEIGLMAEAFNSMSARLQALFRLIQRIQDGKSPEQSLCAIFEELGRFIPLDLTGIVLVNPAGGTPMLAHVHPVATGILGGLAMKNSALREAMESDGLVRIPDLRLVSSTDSEGCLECRLQQAGFSTALLLPVSANKEPLAVLILAARRRYAYLLEQEELVQNLAPVLAHGLQSAIAVRNQGYGEGRVDNAVN